MSAATPTVRTAAQSVGSPSEGRLEGGVELHSSREIRLSNPRGAHFGLPSLIALVERSARRVAQRFEGATLLVGDLSRKQGGDLAGHKSHESGRDADIAFLFVGPNGQTVAPAEFLVADESGVSVENRAYRFDDARNWTLVEAWVTDPTARVDHIFVADHIRARLLAYARARGTYLPVLHRAALAMKQPRTGQRHDDHFHIRIECPRGQHGVCVSEPSMRNVEHVSFATLPRRSPRPFRALVKPRKERETTRR